MQHAEPGTVSPRHPPSAIPQPTLSGDIIGGITTFFTMAYIVVVNPGILSSPGTGMAFSGVLTATVLLAFAMTLMMGLYAKLPFAVAPGMGLNAFFAFTIVLQHPQIVVPAQLAAVPLLQDTALWVALILAAFTILFGTRHLDAAEHHEGMVAAIAFESLVKLVAFIAVGAWVTWGLYAGFGDLFGRAAAQPRGSLGLAARAARRPHRGGARPTARGAALGSRGPPRHVTPAPAGEPQHDLDHRDRWASCPARGEVRKEPGDATGEAGDGSSPRRRVGHFESRGVPARADRGCGRPRCPTGIVQDGRVPQ